MRNTRPPGPQPRNTAGNIRRRLAINWTLLSLSSAAPWVYTAVIAVIALACTPPSAWSHHTGLTTTVTQAVTRYLAIHTHNLPITASTAYTLWCWTGGVSLIAGLTLQAAGARLTWIAWGATTTAMVWSATPDPGRPVATGIALLTWTIGSCAALRGLTRRRARIPHRWAPAPPPTTGDHTPAAPTRPVGPAGTKTEPFRPGHDVW